MLKAKWRTVAYRRRLRNSDLLHASVGWLAYVETSRSEVLAGLDSSRSKRPRRRRINRHVCTVDRVTNHGRNGVASEIGNVGRPCTVIRFVINPEPATIEAGAVEAQFRPLIVHQSR